MTRTALLLITLPAAVATAAPVEVWLTPARRAQLEAITSRPYIAHRQPLGDGTEALVWRNGAREWATTQSVRRIVGARSKNPHAEAKREAAEARAEADALLTDIKALGRKTKVTPADVKAVAERHEKKHGKPRATKGEKP